MEDKTYNGWTNYETWSVALWLNNDQGSYRHCQGLAQEAWDEATDGPYDWQTRERNALYALAGAMRDSVEDDNPLNDSASLYSQLLTGALCDVSWEEIARHYLDEVDKTADVEDVSLTEEDD